MAAGTTSTFEESLNDTDPLGTVAVMTVAVAGLCPIDAVGRGDAKLKNC
jgi:hypothetical protein